MSTDNTSKSNRRNGGYKGKGKPKGAPKGKRRNQRKSKPEPIVNPVKVVIHRVTRDEKGNITSSTSRVVTMPRALYRSPSVQAGLPFEWGNQKVTIY